MATSDVLTVRIYDRDLTQTAPVGGALTPRVLVKALQADLSGRNSPLPDFLLPSVKGDLRLFLLHACGSLCLHVPGCNAFVSTLRKYYLVKEHPLNFCLRSA